ncbi:MAG TPA: sigma-54 dependent transcriptional regulator [Terriglobales bacterium]|jgi:DNA-binding NtrC family response regulator
MSGDQQAVNRPLLIVDDEAGMRTALEINFQRRGWQVETAAGRAEAIARFRQRRHAVVVSDIRMPDGDGLEVMRAAREISALTPVILLTAYGSVPDAVKAMRSGASEYVTKPIVFEQLLDIVERVLAHTLAHPERHDEIIGSSPVLRHSLAQAQCAADSDADVLIEAESGTGKELLARRIHALSARRSRPFIAVNCAAFPETLLESELLGHSRGAFTGAVASQVGKFQLADGGTLLLDEVGDMPITLQPKLLRVLQEREFYPLGCAQPVRLDVRVIATTNQPLEEMVRKGGFRADLYYRLNVIPLSLPPLRARREDIRELALHFADCFAADGSAGISETFLSQLELHSWPGNVRELANVVRRALAMREASFEPGRASAVNASLPATSFLSSDSACASVLTPGTSLAAAEKRLLELTLDSTFGNRSRTAEMLGISLRTVRNKIREYNLPPRSMYVHD